MVLMVLKVMELMLMGVLCRHRPRGRRCCRCRCRCRCRVGEQLLGGGRISLLVEESALLDGGVGVSVSVSVEIAVVFEIVAAIGQSWTASLGSRRRRRGRRIGSEQCRMRLAGCRGRDHNRGWQRLRMKGRREKKWQRDEVCFRCYSSHETNRQRRLLFPLLLLLCYSCSSWCAGPWAGRGEDSGPDWRTT